MTGYEYVSMDKARKMYIPADLESKFRGKKFMVLTMPNGDIILHPVKKFKDSLQRFREVMGPIKGDLKKVKQEILETAMEGL